MTQLQTIENITVWSTEGGIQQQGLINIRQAMNQTSYDILRAQEMALIQQICDRGSLWQRLQRLANIVLRPSAYT
ncbi:MAG: hypothetical protein GY869_13190 [Planctomycetes bacterium]|nr:hypothetical protein [Planctomycetota bacterium]